MTGRRLVCVVEGKGELEAIPNLCARILHHLQRWEWGVDPKPIKQSRGILVNEKLPSPNRPCNVSRYSAVVELARVRPAHAVLILCDSDNDCAVAWHRSAVEVAASRVTWPPVAPVMAVREYEGWLLANEDDAALSILKGRNPEAIRGAKEKLRLLYPGYLPASNQLELTRKINIPRLRERSASFDKLVRSIAAICV